jgi:hypothetical protein
MSMVSALIAGLLFGVGLMEVMDGPEPSTLARAARTGAASTAASLIRGGNRRFRHHLRKLKSRLPARADSACLCKVKNTIPEPRPRCRTDGA